MFQRSSQKTRSPQEHAASKSKWYYDRKAGQRAVEFFENQLVHIEGELAGQPFLLETWQKKTLWRFFGVKKVIKNRPLADWPRRYRVLFIFIPRKNGKSAFGSGIALYILFADQEPGAQVVSAAADREQAAIVYNVAKEMVEANPKLHRLANVYQKTMAIPSSASSYKVLSAEAFTKHGLNLHGAVVDELHAQPKRDLVDVLRTSMSARRQPALVFLTTAGYDRHSVCYEYYDYAKGVLSGTIPDDSFLPIIFEAVQPEGKDVDFTDIEIWKQANPNLGVSKKWEYMEQECAVAQDVPAYENTFKRLELNIWTEQEERWLQMAKWDKCGQIPINPVAYEGRPCYAGLDLASTIDIAALVLMFPMEDETFHILPYFWVPADTVRLRMQRDKVPYDVWIRSGHLDTTPGARTDYNFIRARINKLNEMFDIREIACDRWNALQLATDLQNDNYDVVFISQTFSAMSECVKNLMGYILSEQVQHGQHPVLRWMAGNVVTEQDALGNLRMNKKKSPEKIDGMVASAMAMHRCMAHQNDDDESIYEDRGLIVL